MERTALRLLVMAATFWGVATACGGVAPGPRPVITRPVVTRVVETVEAEPGTGHTVIIAGRVIDAVTRGDVPLAQVVVESERGVMRFPSAFTVSLPTMQVITLTVSAPGYAPRQEVLKAHYRRGVMLTLEIPLQPVPVGEPW